MSTLCLACYDGTMAACPTTLSSCSHVLVAVSTAPPAICTVKTLWSTGRSVVVTVLGGKERADAAGLFPALAFISLCFLDGVLRSRCIVWVQA